MISTAIKTIEILEVYEIRHYKKINIKGSKLI
jgi:hypothetical protein